LKVDRRWLGVRPLEWSRVSTPESTVIIYKYKFYEYLPERAIQLGFHSAYSAGQSCQCQCQLASARSWATLPILAQLAVLSCRLSGRDVDLQQIGGMSTRSLGQRPTIDPEANWH
jgi:hypothetical protein